MSSEHARCTRHLSCSATNFPRRRSLFVCRFQSNVKLRKRIKLLLLSFIVDEWTKNKDKAGVLTMQAQCWLSGSRIRIAHSSCGMLMSRVESAPGGVRDLNVDPDPDSRASSSSRAARESMRMTKGNEPQKGSGPSVSLAFGPIIGGLASGSRRGKRRL